jgi:cytoskeletal protein RodZ
LLRAAADNPASGSLIGSMVFNRKGNFFLNLDEKAPEQAAAVAPVTAKPPAAKSAAAASTAAKPSAPAAAAPEATTGAATAPEAGAKTLTTAEAIAAELAAAQASRPAASTATFAPDCLVPGSALPMRRRRGGANLAGFRSMAGGLFGKK